MPPIIEISHLDFAYRDQLVLKHVDLRVERGSTLGVIGPNGGGKTTLILLLLGLLKPTRGTILISGLTPAQAVRRGNILGYLPQNPPAPVNFPLNVRQVVRLGLAGKTGLLRSCSASDLKFADFLIERVGLADRAGDPVGELSGGQRQRAFIARALAARPAVLLLDEPTTGIDRSGQQRFITFLQDLKRELGLTLVFTSHDLLVVSGMSDRVACLNLTLHYHDIPSRLPAGLVLRMFACDLEALGVHQPPSSPLQSPPAPLPQSPPAPPSQPIPESQSAPAPTGAVEPPDLQSPGAVTAATTDRSDSLQ